MKKIIFLCFCALLASCTSDEDLQDINTNEKELANMINDYELVLKGYSLDELKPQQHKKKLLQSHGLLKPYKILLLKSNFPITTAQEQMQEHTQEQLPWKEFLSMKRVVAIASLYILWIVKMVEIHIHQE